MSANCVPLHGTFTLDPGSATLIIEPLLALTRQVTQMQKDLQTAFDAVDAKLATADTKIGTLTTVAQSNTTLLQALSAEIASLKTTTTDPAVLARLTAMGTKVDTQIAAIDAATTGIAASDTANVP